MVENHWKAIGRGLKELQTNEKPSEHKFVTLCERKSFAEVEYFPKAVFNNFCTDACLNALKAYQEIFCKTHSKILMANL
jgi:hypothetical protein